MNILSIEQIFQNEAKLTRAESFKRFLVCIAAISARFVFLSSDSVFSSFSGALKSTDGKHYLSYLTALDSSLVLSDALIDQLAAELDDCTPIQFIENFCPTLFSGSAEDAFSQLVKDSSKVTRPTIFAAIKLATMCMIRERLANSAHPSFKQLREYEENAERGEREPSKPVLGKVLLKEFENLGTPFDNLKFATSKKKTAEVLVDLWQAMLGFSGSPVGVNTTARVSEVLNTFADAGSPRSEQLRLLYCAKFLDAAFGKRKSIKSIINPLHYIRGIVSKRLAAKSTIASAPSSGSIGTALAGEAFFNEVVEKLRGINTLDALLSLHFHDRGRELVPENRFVYPETFNVLFSTEKQVLIVDANPAFIKALVTDGRIDLERVHLAFTERELAELYELHFRELANPATPSLQSILYFDKDAGTLNTVALDEASDIEESDALFSEKYDVILGFDRDKTVGVDAWLGLWKYSPGGELWLYLPNTMLDDKDGNARERLVSIYSSIDCTTVPAQISGTKTCLIRCSRSSGSKQVKMRRLLAYKVNRKRTVCPSPWNVSIPVAEFSKNDKTLNRLFTYALREKPASPGGRRETRQYEFSKEIPIFYSWSDGSHKLRFYYYELPNAKQRQRNPLSRGKKLIASPQMHATRLELALSKIERAVLDDAEFQSVISKETLDKFKDQPLSLKTFWYTHLADYAKLGAYDKEVAAHLLSSPDFANLMPNSTLTRKDYDDLMAHAFPGADEERRQALWEQLDVILSHAAKTGGFTNPIAEYMAEMRESRKALRAVRRVLAKKSFTRDEEKAILNHMHRRLPADGLMLGCAIRFHSGLSPREICALTWGDFYQVFRNGTHQLIISKVRFEDGTTTSDVSNRKTLMRRVPISNALAKLISARRDYVAEQREHIGLDASDGTINKLPIVTADEIAFAEFCVPSDLTPAARDVVGAAKIEPLSVDLTDNGTDLNEYGGDIFRENFKFRAIQTCMLTQAELCYLLGQSMPDTFSKHYCDYSNDFAQHLVSTKLNRWTAAYEFQASSFCEENSFSLPKRTKQKHISFCENADPAVVDMDIRAGDSGDIELCIKSEGGASIEVIHTGRSERG